MQIRIYFDASLAIGPGRIKLLEGVQRTGSLPQAARDMDMSYRRTWILMQSLNESRSSPASIPARGGQRGGAATVTLTGGALIRAYPTAIKVTRSVSRQFAEFARPTATASISRVRPNSAAAK